MVSDFECVIRDVYCSRLYNFVIFVNQLRRRAKVITNYLFSILCRIIWMGFKWSGFSHFSWDLQNFVIAEKWAEILINSWESGENWTDNWDPATPFPRH